MDLHDMCNKVHLPTLAAHYALGNRISYFKIPGFGWYGKYQDDGRVFNCVDLFQAHSGKVFESSEDVIRNAYQFFTSENTSFLELPMRYSEVSENRITADYKVQQYNTRFYKRCREEALNGVIRYNDRLWRFTKLLEELNMPQFIYSGVGLINAKVLNAPQLKGLLIQDAYCNKIILPTFYTIDNRVASLEVCDLQNITARTTVYTNKEMGWYGTAGKTLVGNARDLFDVDGCTWDRKLGYWDIAKPVDLHRSLTTAQCLDIWCNGHSLPTTQSPLELLKVTGQLDQVNDYMKDLSVGQMRELEKLTGKELHKYWLAHRYEETQVSGIKFSCRDGQYYFQRNGQWYEFTNFMVNLTELKKDMNDGEFYQYGEVIMKDSATAFRAKRKLFCSQEKLLQELSATLLEAGIGIPTVAPNLKHYLANVIDAFNTENNVKKPTPATTTEVTKVLTELPAPLV